MICNFCGNPAAHEATGCRYGPRYIACFRCVIEVWAWIRTHVNGKGRKKYAGMPTFYECAGTKIYRKLNLDA